MIGTAIKTIPVRFCSYLISCQSIWFNKTKTPSIHFQMDSWTDGWRDTARVSNRVGTHHFLVFSLSSLDGGVYVSTQITNSMKSFVKTRTKRCVFFFHRKSSTLIMSDEPLSQSLVRLFNIPANVWSSGISEAPCWSKPRQREGIRTRDASVCLQHLAEGKNSQTWPLAIWRVTRVS